MQSGTEQLDKITANLIKLCEDANSMTREFMGASLQSVTAMTKGCGDVCESVNSLVQKSLEQSAEAGRAAMGVKNFQDLMEVHSNLLKTGFDNLVEEMGKISQITARMAQQTAEPLANQVNSTVCKFSGK